MTATLLDKLDVPAHLLDAPTVGAWQRANDVTGPCEAARIELARAIAEEALRRAIIDALDPILVGLHRRADPRDIARRLERLVADLTPDREQVAA